MNVLGWSGREARAWFQPHVLIVTKGGTTTQQWVVTGVNNRQIVPDVLIASEIATRCKRENDLLGSHTRLCNTDE
jgi:hypothetical protein